MLQLRTAIMNTDNIVVWEVIHAIFATYQTYSAEICAMIEKAYQEYRKSNDQKSSLVRINRSNYRVDLLNMVEIEEGQNGRILPVRRLVFPHNSPFGNQVTWQWDNANGYGPCWEGYPADVVDLIEHRFQTKHKKLDLSKKFSDLNYTVDFTKMEQRNNTTLFSRKIQRHATNEKYPTESTQSTSVTLPTPSRPSRMITRSIAKAAATVVPAELVKYANAAADPPDEQCCICMASLLEDSAFADPQQGAHSNHADVVELKKCKHMFHSDCLKAAFKNDAQKASLTCPYCKTIYGVKMGTQPPGTMDCRNIGTSLPGHPGCGAIQITYNFRGGIQSSEHPNPGQPYHAHSFPRTAFLPDNKEGKKVLELLKVAWNRRLIFTVGQSVTTGARNTITWNEIHHKTSMCNHSGHGYPDPNYLHNVTEELKIQGVTEDDLH